MSMGLSLLSCFVSFSLLALLSVGLTLSSGSKKFRKTPHARWHQCVTCPPLEPGQGDSRPESGAPLEQGPVY